MNKEEIIESLNLDIPLDVNHMNTLMFMYRMNQISELGLISGGGVTVTGSGFDIVHDTDLAGWKLSQFEMLKIMRGLSNQFTEDMFEMVISFIEHLEDVGYSKMKEEIESLEV